MLHFDFKDNQAPLLHAVWDMLGEYQGWITTAVKSADPHRLAPFEPKPLLVLTEDSDAQEAGLLPATFRWAPGCALFGSAHTKAVPVEPEGSSTITCSPPCRPKNCSRTPTNYRRWWNNSWYEVEEGGQHQAGDWTPADDRRLRALVDHAHKLGYWIRFYTLDGFAPDEDRGWGNDYNFGTREAVMARWKAAVAAGVNLIASNQYEELAAAMRGASR